MNTNKIFFIGLGSLGGNAIFELKKRLLKIESVSGRSLLSLDDNTGNPYQFLTVTESSSESIWDVFDRVGFTGTDRNLFRTELEVCALAQKNSDIGTEKSETWLSLFRKGITTLAQFDSAAFKKRTGLDTFHYPAAAILVFDIAILKNPEWGNLIKTLLDEAKNIHYRDKFHAHALVYAQRTVENSEPIKELGNFFHNIFLFDGESNHLILDKLDDQIDLAANFLQVVTQFDSHLFEDYFQNGYHNKYYSFGSTQIYYPKNEILSAAVQQNLGDPKFGWTSGRGKRFFDFYVGRFKTVTDEISRKSFWYKGNRDVTNDEDIFSDRFQPEPRDSVKIRADRLKEEAMGWLGESVDLISEQLRHESLIERIEKMTKFNVFSKICLERWEDNLKALEFIVQRDVIGRAKNRATVLKARFQQRWEEVLTDLYAKGFKPNDNKSADPGEPENEHGGELLWHLSERIIAEIQEVLIPEKARPDEYTDEPKVQNQKIIKTTSVSWNELQTSIENMPRGVAMTTRLLLFTSLLIFFWNDFHDLMVDFLFKTPSIAVSSWITGITVWLLFILAFYWFGYRKKLNNLLWMLKAYLIDILDHKKQKIETIQKELSIEFLRQAADLVRSKYLTRPEFFELVIKQGKTCFTDLVATHPQFNIDVRPLNPIEAYYFNRYWLYTKLQKHLEKLNEGAYTGSLRISIPDKRSEEFNDRISDLADNFSDYSTIETAKNSVDQFMWTVLLNKEEGDNFKALVDNYLDGVIAEVGKGIQGLNDQHPGWTNLYGVLDRKKYQIDTSTFTELTERAFPTFKLSEQIPPVMIFTKDDQFFSEAQKRSLLKSSFDKSSIVFVRLTGPLEFDDIQWEA